MYRKLQQQAKEHIIVWLNDNPNNLVFDIDTHNPDATIMKCQSLAEKTELVFGEEIMPNYVLNCIGKKLDDRPVTSLEYIWIYAVRYLIEDIFKIYGFEIIKYGKFSAYYEIMGIESEIQAKCCGNTNCYTVVPLEYIDFIEKIGNKCPLLILLDPIMYFSKCSTIIKELQLNGRDINGRHTTGRHTIGIDKIFLARFPEKDDNLFRIYLEVQYIFEPYCLDICSLVLIKLIDLLQTK